MRTQVWHKILIAPCLIALVSLVVIRLRHPTQQATQRKWFRAVTHIPSTLQGKTRTQLFFDIGQHSILLGIGGAPTNTGFSVSIDHSNPLIAGEIAEAVARVLRNQMAVSSTNAFSASFPKVE